MIRVIGISNLPRNHSITLPCQLRLLVFRSPPEQEVACFQQFRFDQFYPFFIPCVAIVLTHAPQCSTGFYHITAKILNHSIIMLFFQKKHQRPAGNIGQPHGVIELDYGRAFGTDGRIYPDRGGKRAIGIHPIRNHIQLQEPGMNHFIDSWLGNTYLCRVVQFLFPEPLAFIEP